MTAGACKHVKTCSTRGAHEHTCTKVASGLASVAGITASTQKFIDDTRI